MAKRAKRAAGTAKILEGRYKDFQDPQVFSAQLRGKAEQHLRIVGLDLGNSCGVAALDLYPGVPLVDCPIYLGQWDLSLSRYDSGIISLLRLQAFITVCRPDFVAFEQPMFTPNIRGPRAAVLLQGAMRSQSHISELAAALMLWCHTHSVPYCAYTSTTIKRFATGKGNASKEDMVNAAKSRLSVVFPDGSDAEEISNMVDAAFCGLLAFGQHRDGLASLAALQMELPPEVLAAMNPIQEAEHD